MNSCLVLVAISVASQLTGGQGRYSEPSNPATSSNVTTGNSTNTSLLNSQPPANNASGPSSTSPTSRSPYSKSPPPGFGDQRSGSSSNNNGSPALGGPQSPLGTTYPQQQPGFDTDDSAANAQVGPSPTKMMQEMLTAPPDSQLRGESVRLIQVISTGGTRNEQTQRVDAYWDLCSSVADYYLGLREKAELGKLGSSSQPSQSWTEAVQKFTVRLATSLRAAKASQYRLAYLMVRGSDNLPLPGDLPHCGSYLTKYQEIFAGRSSLEAQELANLLPARYTELKDSAADVLSAQDWLSGVQARSTQSDSAGNIQAMELLALRRRAFVQIARDYNRRIARYSELAAPGQIGPERLTGILIKRPAASTRSAVLGKQQSSEVDSAPPQTFVSGSVRRDEAVRPTSGQATTPGGERSLHVPLH